MVKFGRLFKENHTRVQIEGIDGWYLIKEVHETRNWIKVYGVMGSFQRGHIYKFTNKDGV